MEQNEEQFDEELLYVTKKVGELKLMMPPPQVPKKGDPRALKHGYYKAVKDGKAHLLYVSKGVVKKSFMVDYEYLQPIERLISYQFDRIELLEDRRFSNMKLRFTFDHNGDTFEIDFFDLRHFRRFFNFVKSIWFKKR